MNRHIISEKCVQAIETFKKYVGKVIPYNSKFRVFAKILVQLVYHPKQLLYYLTPQKIGRVIYYFRHGGLNQVARILDERILMGANLQLNLDIDKMIFSENISDYPILNFQEAKQPQVSIIIPVYNQFAFTYSCLKSVLKNTGNISYEVIVADDCSTDLTCRLNDIAQNVRIIKTPQNYKFLKNCNSAACKAKGQYILFFNNYTQVQPGWLKPLVQLMEKDEHIGIIGSKLVYPDGRLQEAGGIVWKDGSAWNYGHGNNPALPEYNYVKSVDYISGASMMIRKALWEQIGGFDERYVPAYCEDSDLAFQVREMGYDVVLHPLSIVVHFEGKSNGTNTNLGVKVYQPVNQGKFFNKWKKQLESEHLPNGIDPFLARDRSQLKKRILIIDHMVPKYDRDAGAKNVFMYTKMFIDMGMKVTFLPADYFPYQPYTSELEQIGVEVLYGNYYFKYWKEWLAENLHYFDYIYLNRPHIAIRFIEVIQQYATGKIIYFGHDLHYLREEREYEVSPSPELLKSINKWKKIEYQLINVADVVYVVGGYEQNLLQKRFPQKTIRNIPIFLYEPLENYKKPSIVECKDILFVGGFNHPPNIDAVLWFAKEIFPRILKKIPDIHWFIVGSNPTKEIFSLSNDHITVTGFISDENLREYYRNCRLVVVPLRYGAGVKGKVVEGIYYHCPLVTTPTGAEGISTQENVFEVVEANEEMADHIVELYNNLERLDNMSQNCASFIKKYYTKECARDIIQLDIHI